LFSERIKFPGPDIGFELAVPRLGIERGKLLA